MKPTRTDESVDQYVKRIKKHGWKVLGMGHFSTVMQKHGHQNLMRINTGDYDAGWEEFISHLKRSSIKHNPHFAKYGEVQKYKHVQPDSGDIDFYVVGEIERLKTFDKCDYDNASRIIDHIICHIEGARESLSYQRRNIKHIPYIPKTLYSAVDFLLNVKEKSKVNLRFDVHEFNIMSRDGGDLVITDPFSYDSYS